MQALSKWEPNLDDGRVTRTCTGVTHGTKKIGVASVAEQEYPDIILFRLAHILTDSSDHGTTLVDAAEMREHIINCLAVLADMEGQNRWDRAYFLAEAGARVEELLSGDVATKNE
jgi:hypothetical protein